MIYHIGAILGALFFLYVCFRIVARSRMYERRPPAVYTSIYPSTPDDTTASGYHEESRKA